MSDRIAMTLLRVVSPSSSFRENENFRNSLETITIEERDSWSLWSIRGRRR
jgi:hypothetical protein